MARPVGRPVEEKTADTHESNVSLDFRDADIANVLKILSYKSGVNIVVGPEVTGLVTIQLNDVPWKQALEVVLETYGYAYEQKGNIITVTTVENLKLRRENAIILAEQEPVETKTFTLNFGRASEIVASIEKMKSERGSINYDKEFQASDLKIEGIILGVNGQNLAIINGQIVQKGDQLGSLAVEEIGKNMVILKQGEQKFELKLNKEE